MKYLLAFLSIHYYISIDIFLPFVFAFPILKIASRIRFTKDIFNAQCYATCVSQQFEKGFIKSDPQY